MSRRATMRGLLIAIPLWASTATAVTTADVTTFFSFAPVGPGGLGGPSTPHSNVMQASDGNFYGASAQGGINNNGIPGPGGMGTVYKVTPEGTGATLYSFGATPTDGVFPESTPVETGGYLFGTTPFGGAHNNDGTLYSGSGTIYRITLSGTYTSLYSFGANATDGIWPVTLVAGPDGALYGTTFMGGAHGKGAFFRITTTGTYTQLHSFGGPGDVETAGVVDVGADGHLYGVGYGGAYEYGAFLRMATDGTVTVLYAFGGCSGDARLPTGLRKGADGNFYGVSAQGGDGNGTMFVVTPAGIERVLHRFAAANGHAQVSFGPGGNLYGVTQDGGENADGSLYMVTPSGEFTELYSFVPEDDFSDSGPGGLLHASDGALYGYTQGRDSTGTLFRAAITGAPTATLPTGISATCDGRAGGGNGGGGAFGALAMMLAALARRHGPFPSRHRSGT